MQNNLCKSKSNHPLISVILPVYNSEKTIEKTLNSILSQTYNNFEILIYDDASSDATASIIQSVINSEPRIKLYCNKKNRGAGYARKYLLQKAKGEYFAFLDSDDQWKNSKLEKQLKFMETNDLGICCCHYDIVNDDGKLLGSRKPPKEITFTKMHLANWLPMSMTIVKASLVGSRDMPLLKRRQDYAYWLSILKYNRDTKCKTFCENLGYYNRRGGSLSSSKRKNVTYNFLVFNQFMKYNKITAAFFVFLIILTRIIRV